jgi:hypothetical protein
MRFMILVKATEDTEAGVMPTGEQMETLMADMGRYHEELAKAGVLLDASGLQPSSMGWRIAYDGSRRTVIDGPFAEAKELVAGYTLIEVASREEALEWTRRYPNPAGDGLKAVIEVRPLYDLDVFPEGEALQRFRDLDLPSQR